MCDAMTVKQKQCLLAYLGYYAGNVDGIWGPLSQNAANAFERDWGSGEIEEALKQAVAGGMPEKADFWSRIQYFTRQEFACKCGKCGGFPAEPDQVLVELAEDVRGHFGVPMILSSGVRCAAHNTNVGGVSGSRHLKGKAADFSVQGKSAAQILAFVRTDPRTRYAYAIDERFVHMDVA